MNNFDFLQTYQQLQNTIMFDKLIKLGFATISYNEEDKLHFWNNALVNKILTDEELSKIEAKLQSLDRKSAVYFENKANLKALKDFLEKHGYKRTWEDSWMFWDNREIGKSRFNFVKKVTNDTELKVFLKTFDACYQENDPQNPYGTLGDYLGVTEKVWHRHHKTNRLEYFIVYKNDKPVAVSTLTNYREIGYISNVGSLQELRLKGFGKLATFYCVEQSKKQSNTEHCIATEEGTYPNEFYKRIGFNTRFTAVGYLKQ